MVFTPTKNPTADQIRTIVAASAHEAARRLIDLRNGDAWYWPFEQATHREGADHLAIPYDRRPGEGDVIFL